MAYPSVAKCTVDFVQGTYGWTESYYRDSPSSSLEAEGDALTELIAKRIKLSGAQTFVKYAKVSNEAVKRDVKVKYYGEPGAGAYQGTSGEDSEPQNTALQVIRKATDNQHTSMLYMRGIWDRCVTAGGGFLWDDPAWSAAFGAYSSIVLNGQWGFLAKDPATPGTQFILAILPQPGGQVQITTTNPIFAAGDLNKKKKIFISGVTGAASLNGTQIVVPSTTSVFKTVNRIPMFDWTGGGQATPNNPTFFPFATLNRGRVIERKAGRPSYQSRGRQRVRKLA